MLYNTYTCINKYIYIAVQLAWAREVGLKVAGSGRDYQATHTTWCLNQREATLCAPLTHLRSVDEVYGPVNCWKKCGKKCQPPSINSIQIINRGSRSPGFGRRLSHRLNV